MLTVDFDRLDLREGHRLLDMGCGGGRHAFTAMRRGATVVALDYDAGELKEVRATRGAMIEGTGRALRAPVPSLFRVPRIPDGVRTPGDIAHLQVADASV